MAALIRLFTGKKKKDGRKPGSALSNTTRNLKTDLECKIMHLEEDNEFTFYMPKNALASQLYDYVLNHLAFNSEEDYFGLQYTDTRNINHWLDPTKKIRKQCEIGPPYTLKLRVKFFSSEPQQLKDEFTRYLFVLQLRRDIRNGRLRCGPELAAELAALCLQGEFGDYDETVHSLNFISSFRFLPENLQTESFEHSIVEEYRQLASRHLSPAQTDKMYLDKVRHLEDYGVNMHHVKGKDESDYILGLTPTGVLVYEGDHKIGLFFWPMILKLEFKKSRLKLVVADEDEATKELNEHTFIFSLPDYRACKHLWKCAVEHHTFFRVMEAQRPPSKGQQVFRMRSRFHSSFRTEYQLHRIDSFGSTSRSSSFVRQASKRFTARQSFERQELKAKRERMLEQKRNAQEITLPPFDIIGHQCKTEAPYSSSRDDLHSAGPGKSPVSMETYQQGPIGHKLTNLNHQVSSTTDSSDSDSDSGGRFIEKRSTGQEPIRSKLSSTSKWSEKEEKESIAAEKAQAILKGLEEAPSSSNSKAVKNNVNLLHNGSMEEVDDCGDNGHDLLIPLKNNEVNLYAPKANLPSESLQRNNLNSNSVNSDQTVNAQFAPEFQRPPEPGAVVESNESSIKLTNVELAEQRERQKRQIRKTSLPRPVTRPPVSSDPSNINPHQPSRLPKASNPSTATTQPHPARHSQPSSLPVLSNSPVRQKIIAQPSTELPVLPVRHRASLPTAGSSIPVVNHGATPQQNPPPKSSSRIQPPSVTRTNQSALPQSTGVTSAPSNQSNVSRNTQPDVAPPPPQLKGIPRPSGSRLATSSTSGSQLPVSNRSKIPPPSSSGSSSVKQ